MAGELRILVQQRQQPLLFKIDHAGALLRRRLDRDRRQATWREEGAQREMVAPPCSGRRRGRRGFCRWQGRALSCHTEQECELAERERSELQLAYPWLTGKDLRQERVVDICFRKSRCGH